MAKENFTYRIEQELKDELEALAGLCGKLEGRRVTVAEIMTRCIDAGKSFVENDIRSGFTVPRTAKTELDKVIAIAKQAVYRGFELPLPHAAQ